MLCKGACARGVHILGANLPDMGGKDEAGGAELDLGNKKERALKQWGGVLEVPETVAQPGLLRI